MREKDIVYMYCETSIRENVSKNFPISIFIEKWNNDQNILFFQDLNFLETDSIY